MPPSELLRRAYAPEPFRRAGHALVDRLADYLATVSERPANRVPEPGALLDKYRGLLGGDAGAVLEEFLADSVHLHHPNYVGHQVVPPAPAAALAALTDALLSNGMAIYEMGAAASALERIVTETFARMLELAPGAGGFLTSGGTLANLTALLAARARRWPEAGGDVWERGQAGLRPCLLVNAQAHYCIDRAVRIMGWGAEGIVHVPYDAEFRMRTELIDETLAAARGRGLTPLALVGSACTTATGSYDDLDALADAAERHGLWLHVDGAHGAAVRLDPERAHLVAGLERADSLTLDFHKMLLAPALTTGLFFRDGRDAYRTFHQRADYLLNFDAGEEDWYNYGRRTFECTKHAMSLRVYTLLSEYGEPLFRDYVARVGALARELARLVTAAADLELLLPPDVNIVCFRYRPYGRAATATELDDLNALIRAAILADGHRYLVQTQLAGRTWLRCTITNPLTEPNHLAELVADVTSRGQMLTDCKRMTGFYR